MKKKSEIEKLIHANAELANMNSDLQIKVFNLEAKVFGLQSVISLLADKNNSQLIEDIPGEVKRGKKK